MSATLPIVAPTGGRPPGTASPEGANNAEWDNSQDRIIRGHSYKDCGIVAIIPTRDGTFDHRFVSSWEGIIRPPNHPFSVFRIANMEVGDAYNVGIWSILNNPELMKWNSGKGPIIATVEDDQILPADALMKLLATFHSSPYAAVSALYWTKGGGATGGAMTPVGGCAQIWGSPTDWPVTFAPQLPRNGEVQECRGIGMGCALWDIGLFQDVRTRQGVGPNGVPIWFKTWQEVKDGIPRISTQDLSFCDVAQKAGYRFAVDTNVRVGHLDRTSGWIF